MPPMPAVTNSPKPMVPTLTKYGRPVNLLTHIDTMKAFNRTGGRMARYLLGIFEVKYAAARVVRLPNIKSTGPRPPIILAKKHPTNKPGIASGIKKGKIVITSDILNSTPLTCPKDREPITIVRTQYIAAIIPALFIYFIFCVSFI